MTTTTTAKRSGKKRDISEVVFHSCKVKGHCAIKCRAKKPLPWDTTTKWCSLHKTRSYSDKECTAQQATPQSLPPVFCIASDHFPCHRDLLIYLRGKLIVFVHQERRTTTTGRQRLLISYGGPRHDSERRPAPSRLPGASTTNNFVRSRIARVVSHRNDEAHDGCREHCRYTTRGEHVCFVGTWSWS